MQKSSLILYKTVWYMYLFLSENRSGKKIRFLPT
mgnify:FL=1